MVHDMLNYLPDYLTGFEEVEKLLFAIAANMRIFDTHMSSMERGLKMDIYSDRWEKLIHIRSSVSYKYKRYKILHMIYPVVTLNELSYFLSAWLDEGKYKIEFDKESLTFTVKTTHTSTVVEEHREDIRKLLPLNCEVKIEFIDELE